MNLSATDESQRRLAIIGCGAVVEQVYEWALRKLAERGWTLLFIDATVARARDLALRFRGAEALTTLDEVIGRAAHAIVATPPASHYAVCSRLLQAGIHVLCEKPFVLEPAEGYALVKQASVSGLKLHVNQTRRWYPSSLVAKNLLADGAVGELTSITMREGARFNWPAKTAFHSQSGLIRNGMLSDLGAHTFDLVGWVIGQPLEVLDLKHDGYAGPEMTVCAKFQIGRVKGDGIMTWLIPVPSKIQFVGTKGRVIIDENFNRALLQTGNDVRVLPGITRYTAYQGIATDIIEAFIAGSDHAAVATAESVMPSIVFLDHAYTMAKAELPFITAIGTSIS